MKWAYTPPPEMWAKRTVRRFAYLPVLVEDDDCRKWCWLERYDDYQEYTTSGYGRAWVTIARYTP